MERVGFFGEKFVPGKFDLCLYAYPIWILYIRREDIGNGEKAGGALTNMQR